LNSFHPQQQPNRIEEGNRPGDSKNRNEKNWPGMVRPVWCDGVESRSWRPLFGDRY
jgi:hypothetical protein